MGQVLSECMGIYGGNRPAASHVHAQRHLTASSSLRSASTAATATSTVTASSSAASAACIGTTSSPVRQAPPQPPASPPPVRPAPSHGTSVRAPPQQRLRLRAAAVGRMCGAGACEPGEGHRTGGGGNEGGEDGLRVAAAEAGEEEEQEEQEDGDDEEVMVVVQADEELVVVNGLQASVVVSAQRKKHMQKKKMHEGEVRPEEARRGVRAMGTVAAASVALPLIPDKEAVYDLVGDNEEVCPTCLETYTDDNPKISPTCGHAFHLQCLCAWNERSGSRFCPICARRLEFEGADALLVG